MKKTIGYLIAAVLVALLAANNPSTATYARLVTKQLQSRISSNLGRGLFGILSGSVTQYIANHTNRTNLLLFSLYRTTTPAGDAIFIGAFSYIIPLSLPSQFTSHLSRSATSTGPSGNPKSVTSNVSVAPSTETTHSLARASQSEASSSSDAGASLYRHPCAAKPSLSAPAADAACISANSYTPTTSPNLVVPLSDGQSLLVWGSMATGSADGHAQAVFFFVGQQPTSPVLADGQLASTSSPQIISIKNGGGETVIVTYADYLPQNPLCCPTGAPVSVTYRWETSRLVASANPPQ